MTLPLTFVLACAPYHAVIVERAIASVQAQTVPCDVVVVNDHERRGSGWTRNRGLEQVVSNFTSFLDADDTIEPTFAEECLRAYDGMRYVFTDWRYEDKPGVVQAPDCSFQGRVAHILTTLLPTAWVKHIGGFDETLHGDEDLDFYLKLTTSGLCGKRLPQALFTYGKQGQRARGYIFGSTAVYGGGEHFSATQALLSERYGERYMACCNDNVNSADFGAGEHQPGDVLARWLVDGQRQRTGGITGRVYRKFGNALTMYMSPADVDFAPTLYTRVVDMPPPVDEDSIQRWKAQMAMALGAKAMPRAASMLTVQDTVALSDGGAEVVPAPDVGKLLRLYDWSRESHEASPRG